MMNPREEKGRISKIKNLMANKKLPTNVNIYKEDILSEFETEDIRFREKSKDDLEEVIEQLLKVGHIRKCDRVDLYSISYFYAKREKHRVRAIYVPRKLNEGTVAPKFKMVGVYEPLLRPHLCYYATIDFSNAFTHVPLDKNFARWFGIELRGKYYMWNVMMFGWSIAPFIQ